MTFLNVFHQHKTESPLFANKDSICKLDILTLYVLIFLRENINIYLQFVSFVHIDTTQLVEILTQIRQEPTYST